VVLQVDRHEEHGHDHQGRGRHQFIHGNGHADAVAGTAHADELLGRDVRRDQRCADGPPRERAFGQEVVVRCLAGTGLLAPVNPDAITGHDNEVKEEDEQV
jgi:hypothetical protein